MTLVKVRDEAHILRIEYCNSSGFARTLQPSQLPGLPMQAARRGGAPNKDKNVRKVPELAGVCAIRVAVRGRKKRHAASPSH